MSTARVPLRERQAFFDAVIASLRAMCPASDFRLLGRASRPWIRRPLETPRSGLYLDAFQAERPEYLGFYSVHERAPDVYRELHKRKASIQAAFDEPLEWHPTGIDGNGCNIVIEVPFDLEVAADRRRAVPWVADRLRRFDEVFPI